MSKARCIGHIFIDWLRNKPLASAIAPYSLRARRTASVATPVTWSQLRVKDSAALFTARVRSVARIFHFETETLTKGLETVPETQLKKLCKTLDSIDGRTMP